MADETANRPLEDLQAREAAIETREEDYGRGPAMAMFEPGPAEPMTAQQRLRAFEDQHLGPDAVRIGGEIERGSGSHYRDRLSTEQRAQHLALEQLVKAEDDLAAASAELARAETAHEAAMARLAAMEDAAHGHE